MQVLSISSLKGGVGKTSVTLGLTSAARAAGLKTLVIDLDPHGDSSTGLGAELGTQQPVGHLLRNVRKANVADHVVKAGWPQASSSGTGTVDVLVGSSLSGYYDRPDLRRRDLQRLARLLENVSGYDLVLIDCPPSLNGLTRMAWLAATRIVLVAEPTLFSVAGTERSLRGQMSLARQFGSEAALAGVVVNRYNPDNPEHQYRIMEMERMFGDKLLLPAIPESNLWQQVQGAAYPIHAWPRPEATEIASLFDELLERLRK
ncbi:ParA family protein [Micrococcoides hystricis]|uniref:ParA family protein n=1 Tax=Micrococcoides hystricis TaxID=1572761 RepID=A0ABV6P868_9MICC